MLQPGTENMISIIRRIRVLRQSWKQTYSEYVHIIAYPRQR